MHCLASAIRNSMPIKEIGVVVGIHKKSSHYLARGSSAATLLLFHNIPIEFLSALLKHSKLRAF